MEKLTNNIPQVPDVQVVESELCRRAESLTWLSSRLVTGRISAGQDRGARRLLSPPLYSEENSMRSGWLFKPTDTTRATGWQRWGGQCVCGGSVKLLCAGSCGRSRWRLLPTATRGPRRSTRCAPPCGARGWCGSAGPPGSATPWAGSSGGRGCRSWSRPACWPSGGSLVRTAAEKEAGFMFSNKPSEWFQQVYRWILEPFSSHASSKVAKFSNANIPIMIYILIVTW